jgi:hypothetical protein
MLRTVASATRASSSIRYSAMAQPYAGAIVTYCIETMFIVTFGHGEPGNSDQPVGA